MAAVNQAIGEELIPDLADDIKSHSAAAAAAKLEHYGGAAIASALSRLAPGFAQDVLAALPAESRERAFGAASAELARQWQKNAAYPADTIGRMMEPVVAAYPPEQTVGETIDRLRELVKTTFITYVYVLDPQERLLVPGDDARPALQRPRGDAAQRNVPRSVRAAGGDAAHGCDEAGARSPLSGVSGGRCRQASGGTAARTKHVRGAGDRDLAAGRQHGGPGKGGARRHSLVAQHETPSPMAAIQFAYRVPRCGGGGTFPGHARSAGDPRALSAGARGPVREHRVPGARGNAAGHDARRAEAPRGAAGRGQGDMGPLPEWRRGRPDGGARHVPPRGGPASGTGAPAGRRCA